MFEDIYKGFYWSKQFRKSARIVGDVIGKYIHMEIKLCMMHYKNGSRPGLPLVWGYFGSIDESSQREIYEQDYQKYRNI